MCICFYPIISHKGAGAAHISGYLRFLDFHVLKIGPSSYIFLLKNAILCVLSNEIYEDLRQLWCLIYPLYSETTAYWELLCMQIFMFIAFLFQEIEQYTLFVHIRS